MKKKISVLLCVLVAMLCFTACGSKKENLQYDKSTITQATDFLIEYCNSADADTIEQWNKMTDFQIESQLNQAGVPFTKDSFLAALDAWPCSNTFLHLKKNSRTKEKQKAHRKQLRLRQQLQHL